MYCVKNEEVGQSVKEERKILHAIKRKKVKWIGHLWHRNCLLKHVGLQPHDAAAQHGPWSPHS